MCIRDRDQLPLKVPRSSQSRTRSTDSFRRWPNVTEHCWPASRCRDPSIFPLQFPIKEQHKFAFRTTNSCCNLGGEGPALLERAWNPTILIRRDIATFWAPYDFHVNGSFSHCGIDSFQLIKQQGQWFLTNLSWTVERENCEVSPLGPPDF